MTPQSRTLRPAPAGSAGDSRARVDLLYDAISRHDSRPVTPREIALALSEAGIDPRDRRLGSFAEAFRMRRGEGRDLDRVLDRAEFASLVGQGVSLVERSLRRELVVPDFDDFQRELEEIFETSAAVRDGKVASYIPQLARVDPELAAFSVCTVDGQRAAFGDKDERFCLQSSSKPISYCIALEDEGPHRVHDHIGHEPSGRSFNELSLNRDGRPHNPMINAGAIMSCSLIGRRLQPADRFDYVLRTWQRLTGGVEPGFDNAVYLSERRTADRNFALGYFMREHGAFPEDTDLVETLEFYFQCCSLELTVQDFSVVAATLANGGICPLTEERVFSPETVRNALSLMYSCGMYDYSGEWAFSVGLPAKSGVSGVIMVVVPNTLGFVVWSPRLDECGNSVRGIAVCREIVKRFSFHHYDNLVGGGQSKRDPRREVAIDAGLLHGQLLWAASQGDVPGMRRLAVRGVDLEKADYDGRTALHLAASEGRVDAVRYLLDSGVPAGPIDRWGGTPLEDARRGDHVSAAKLLESSAVDPDPDPKSGP